jgi:hypothetical protein
MNLRSLANRVTRSINDNIAVTVLASNGYTIGAGNKQIPAYADPVSGYGQLQALDAQELKQLDGLNIQGKIRAIYLYGALSAVIRPDSKGGDIIQIEGKNWLVVKVLEGWAQWTKCAIQYQGG